MQVHGHDTSLVGKRLRDVLGHENQLARSPHLPDNILISSEIGLRENMAEIIHTHRMSEALILSEKDKLLLLSTDFSGGSKWLLECLFRRAVLSPMVLEVKQASNLLSIGLLGVFLGEIMARFWKIFQIFHSSSQSCDFTL